jgi:hypothetical protein
MHDYQARLEKLRTDAAECRLISDLATDQGKQELFDRLATHLATLADQIERAMLTRVDHMPSDPPKHELDAEADEALEVARSMPSGGEKTEALKKADGCARRPMT